MLPALTPAANMMSGVGSGSGVQVIDSPLLTQQIEAQRLCIKHLKNENNRLKVRIIATSDVLYTFLYLMMTPQRHVEIVAHKERKSTKQVA